ncbi:hypothetical protein NDU88_000836 [Pleurodeles waltl]|uniref:Uncharacterized protein n=1 Tax=Pleurodeles waltl TaxID=8319 RepID=A0AAV7UTH9_PLEWA|nr:hypothetical protein NDU88_000836 [Pleurodeles waltl]
MGKLRARQLDTQEGTSGPGKITQGESEDPKEVVPSLQTQINRILTVIADTKATLQQDIGAVLAGLGLLRAQHHKLTEKVKDVETGLEEVRSAQADVTRQATALADKVRVLEHRSEDD